MRILILLGWLLVPVGFGIWHYGPGQDHLKCDDISKLLARGDQLADDEEWEQAIEVYDEALRLLPQEKVEVSRRIRLAKAKAQLQAGKLSEAHADLRALNEELQTDTRADRTVQAEVRSTLAQAHYHMTWVMRLEGLPREMWEPEIETARQTYRLLAEQAGERGDDKAQVKHQEDLESAVRLERMDLGELQGLPLPKQCKGGSCKKPGSSSKKVAKGKPTQKPKDARGASAGPPPDTGGH